MSGEKKYYRNVITVEILSDVPWGDSILDLNAVDYAISDGGSSGLVTRRVINEQLTAAQVSRALIRQGSDPEFLVDDDEDEHSLARKLAEQMNYTDGQEDE